MFIQNNFARISNLNVPSNFSLNAASPTTAEPVESGSTTGPVDSAQLSQAALTAGRTGPQNLMLFGGDRKTAIETLVASGAKAENPKLGFFKNTLRKIVGGTKTVKKPISANQTIHTKVKSRNFNLKELRLTTKGQSANGGETVRHVDFQTRTPDGKKAQVKDVGTVIGRGTPSRMFEQEKTGVPGSHQQRLTNSYFDPKTGQKFLQTQETADRIDADKMGTLKSHKSKSTHRQIEVLGSDGKVDKRYTFDYANKQYRLDNLDDQGNVTSTYRLPKKTDYFKLVDQLSTMPPSAQAAAPVTETPPFKNRLEMAQVTQR